MYNTASSIRLSVVDSEYSDSRKLTCHYLILLILDAFEYSRSLTFFHRSPAVMSGTVSNQSDATWHKKIRGLTPAGVERMGKVVVASSVPAQHGA